MLDFLYSEHILALLIAVFIFMITILLVGKRWISFPVAVLLLLISLAAGLIINHKQEMQNYFTSSHEGPQAPKDFHQYMLQGMEDLKTEITTEKENLRRVMNQVQEIFDSMDAQKQKLQHFIEEVREQFKTDKTESPADSVPIAPVESPQLSEPSSPSIQTPDHEDIKDEREIKEEDKAQL